MTHMEIKNRNKIHVILSKQTKLENSQYEYRHYIYKCQHLVKIRQFLIECCTLRQLIIYPIRHYYYLCYPQL